MTPGFIPPHGGYKKLKSYQKALIIYDATLRFCERHYAGNRRQTDQMEQAARSGKQNIVEGSLASATSKQTEIHLTNVAKASLGELREDYMVEENVPACPDCSAPMVRRTARNGGFAGLEFWGCSKYPECRATRKTDPA